MIWDVMLAMMNRATDAAFRIGWSAGRKSLETTPEQQTAMREAGERFVAHCLANPMSSPTHYADGGGI